MPVGGINIVQGKFGNSSIFGNNDNVLFKQTFSYPSIGFGRLNEENIAIGIVGATKWMVYKAPIGILNQTKPNYSSYKFWIDPSLEAVRPSFDVQLFCPLNKNEFMGITTAEKKNQRGLFVGRFR